MDKKLSNELKILSLFAVILLAGYAVMQYLSHNGVNAGGGQADGGLKIDVIIFSLIVFSLYILSWIVRLFLIIKKQ